jgi:speckle-type POZ protein
MAEATKPHINLHDIAPATFKVMLQFMYTDSLPGDDELGLLGDAPTEMLEHLLAAADRFETSLCPEIMGQCVCGYSCYNISLR